MANAIRGTREDTQRVTLTIDGVDWGVWDKKTGGKLNANGVTFKPGSLGDPYSLGGSPAAEPITLSRNARLARDWDHMGTLLGKVGVGRCVVKQIALDEDKNAYGRAIVWTGTLDSVGPPDHDSTSNNPAMTELTIAPDGPVVA